MVLINISNHPSLKWSEDQKRGYLWIEDVSFPEIPPEASLEEVERKAFDYTKLIERKINDILYNQGRPVAICLQGEYTFCYILYEQLKDIAKGESNIFLAVPTTASGNKGGGHPRRGVKKTSVFKFVRWRFIPL